MSDTNVVRVRDGDPATCRFECRTAPRTCGTADGECPSGCGPMMDMDCPAAATGGWRRARLATRWPPARSSRWPARAARTSFAHGPAAPSPARSPARSDRGSVARRTAPARWAVGRRSTATAPAVATGGWRRARPATRSPTAAARRPPVPATTTSSAWASAIRTCASSAACRRHGHARAGDGFCPTNCGPTSDSDCAGCGNGRQEMGETCDPCTGRGRHVRQRRERRPDASRAIPPLCRFRCMMRPRDCEAGDGFCPAMCTVVNDADCRRPAGTMCQANIQCVSNSCVNRALLRGDLRDLSGLRGSDLGLPEHPERHAGPGVWRDGQPRTVQRRRSLCQPDARRRAEPGRFRDRAGTT